MRRTVARLALVLALALTLAALAGCGSASTPQTSTTTPPATTGPDSSAPAEEAPAELPPPPADVSGMQDWLAKAYPDAAWLVRIKKIEHVPGEVKDSGGFSNAIVVTTDLDFKSELPVANEISAAIAEAHQTWAKQYVIRFADGKNISAGDIVDMTP